MKNKYIDLIDQTYYFPQDEFTLEGDELRFHNIDLMELVRRYGAPLKFMYLPRISENIQRAKKWFEKAIKKHKYKGAYNYCYCTKSSHFKHVMVEALKNDIHMETSSAFDINIINNLINEGLITKEKHILCNGFKRDAYIDGIADLINRGYENCIPIIDNYEEINLFEEKIKGTYSIGIRIASEEDPRSEFYTSRLGIGYKNIVPFYNREIKDNAKVRLKMLHFFINTGIKDTAYYWNELFKCLRVYARLKKIAPEVDSLNIGGGLPIKTSLNFDYDYEYMINEIVSQIKKFCEEEGVDEPNIYTEFGSFTVGESGANLYKIISQKRQNDREKWDMIDSSFMTTLPDTWAISRHFIMLPLNRWEDSYERVFLGGLTCDSDDYYNSEQHTNAIYLPVFSDTKPLYIGFFNTGAYQETISGFGGVHHCLIPQPKHILINRNEDGELEYEVFSEEQRPEDVLKLLGY